MGYVQKVGDEEGDDGVGSELKSSRGRSRVEGEVESELKSSRGRSRVEDEVESRTKSSRR